MYFSDETSGMWRAMLWRIWDVSASGGLFVAFSLTGFSAGKTLEWAFYQTSRKWAACELHNQIMDNKTKLREAQDVLPIGNRPYKAFYCVSHAEEAA